MRRALDEVVRRIANMIGMNPIGYTHSMFVSYTGDQKDRVDQLRAEVDSFLQLLHYKRDIQANEPSVAAEIKQWIDRADLSIGIYGETEGYTDPNPEIGKPLIHWEYDLVVASRKRFRPFIHSQAIKRASGVQKEFLDKLLTSIVTQSASTFLDSRDFVDKARIYIGNVIATTSYRQKIVIRILSAVVLLLTVMMVLVMFGNPDLRTGI